MINHTEKPETGGKLPHLIKEIYEKPHHTYGERLDGLLYDQEQDRNVGFLLQLLFRLKLEVLAKV